MTPAELKKELERIASVDYTAEDSQRNHQVFAEAHLRTHELLEQILHRVAWKS